MSDEKIWLVDEDDNPIKIISRKDAKPGDIWRISTIWLFNEEGKVCEGTGEYLFIVKKGVLYTPPVSDGILEGITRDSVMTLARDFGIEVVERSMVRSELYTADEFFMTGSAAELVPVNSIDTITVGKGVAGPITQKLQKAYFDAVHGKNAEHSHWLTLVK